jgi:hypothetical protein
MNGRSFDYIVANPNEKRNSFAMIRIGLMHGLVNGAPTSAQKNELRPFTYKVSLFAKKYAILNNKGVLPDGRCKLACFRPYFM